MKDAKSTIEAGKAILGIEFGSTRIKAVLIDQENKPIAQGSHTWENQLVDGLWTYSIEAIWAGVQDCYADLRANVKSQYGIEIENLAAIGISAMMHGYMAFNDKEEILVPFRTWRNTTSLSSLHWQVTYTGRLPAKKFWVSVMLLVCFLSTLRQRTTLPK